MGFGLWKLEFPVATSTVIIISEIKKIRKKNSENNFEWRESEEKKSIKLNNTSGRTREDSFWVFTYCTYSPSFFISFACLEAFAAQIFNSISRQIYFLKYISLHLKSPIESNERR